MVIRKCFLQNHRSSRQLKRFKEGVRICKTAEGGNGIQWWSLRNPTANPHICEEHGYFRQALQQAFEPAAPRTRDNDDVGAINRADGLTQTADWKWRISSKRVNTIQQHHID